MHDLSHPAHFSRPPFSSSPGSRPLHPSHPTPTDVLRDTGSVKSTVSGTPELHTAFHDAFMVTSPHPLLFIYLWALSPVTLKFRKSKAMSESVHHSHFPAHGSCLIKMCLNGWMNEAILQTRFYLSKSVRGRAEEQQTGHRQVGLRVLTLWYLLCDCS